MTFLTTLALTKSRRSCRLLALMVLIGVLSLDSPAHAQKGKKPPKGDPPPEQTPEVLYRHETMSMPTLASTSWNQAHSNGLAVGWFTDIGNPILQPFLYDHDGVFNGGVSPAVDSSYDAFYRLGDLFNSQLPSGWTMFRANGVNRHGDIVGSIRDAQNNYRSYIIDTSATAFADPAAAPSSNSADWTLQLLPEFNAISDWANQINDQGIVMGTLNNPNDFYLYDAFDPAGTPVTLGIASGDQYPQLNNQNHVAGVLADDRAFVFNANDIGNSADDQLWVSPEDPNTQFRNVTDFNDSGFFSGGANVRINGKGPIRQYAYSYSTTGSLDIVIPEWDQQDASGAYVNENNDVLSLAPPYIRDFDILVHAGVEPDFNEQQALVQDLLDPNDPLTSYWFDYEVAIHGMGEREPETGYPRLFAEFYDRDGLIDPFGVVLVPFSTSGTVATTAVPEPSSGWLIGLALGSLLVTRVHRRWTNSLTLCPSLRKISSALAICLSTFLLSEATVAGQNYTLTQTFNDPTPTGLLTDISPGDQFGWAVTLNRRHVLVGAPYDDTFGIDVGQAHLFDTDTGELIHTFIDPTPTPDPYSPGFGSAVALADKYVLIGAPGDDTIDTDVGQAHLFDVTTGGLQKTFNDPTPTYRGFGRGADSFGSSVAVDGYHALIGAPGHMIGDARNVGETHLFDVATGNLLHTFTNPTPAEGDLFGWSVDLENDLVLIGGEKHDGNGFATSQVYLFNTSGELLKTFHDPTHQPNSSQRRHSFGVSVAIDGENILIGDPDEDGEAHLFDLNGNLLHTFNDPTPTSSDFFGLKVALDGDLVLISDSGDDTDGEETGQAHLFDLNGNLLQTFRNHQPEVNDHFGRDLAIDGSRILLAAYEDDANGEDVGQAYLFELQTSSGDFNGDGTVDGKDFLAWQRGDSPEPHSPTDLAAWQASYGAASSLDASKMVPEPGTWLLLGTVLTSLWVSRIRQVGFADQRLKMRKEQG